LGRKGLSTKGRSRPWHQPQLSNTADSGSPPGPQYGKFWIIFSSRLTSFTNSIARWPQTCVSTESGKSQQMTGQRSQWAKDQYEAMTHQFSNRVLKSRPVLRSSSIQQKPCSQHLLSIPPPQYPHGQSQSSRIRVRALDQACSGKQARNLGQELGRTERLEDKVVGASSQALWRSIHPRGHHNQYAL
jgi:hypothetical protein